MQAVSGAADVEKSATVADERSQAMPFRKTYREGMLLFGNFSARKG